MSLTASERDRWRRAIRETCQRLSVDAETDDEIDKLIERTSCKGRSLQDLIHQMELRYGAATAVTAGRPVDPNDKRHWKAVIQRISRDAKLPQTDADIETLMEDTLKRGKTLAELADRLSRKTAPLQEALHSPSPSYAMPASLPAPAPSAPPLSQPVSLAPVNATAPSPGASPARGGGWGADESSAAIDRVCRYLLFHGLAADMAGATALAVQKCNDWKAREVALESGMASLVRMHGAEPHAHWKPNAKLAAVSASAWHPSTAPLSVGIDAIRNPVIAAEEGVDLPRRDGAVPGSHHIPHDSGVYNVPRPSAARRPEGSVAGEVGSAGSGYGSAMSKRGGEGMPYHTSDAEAPSTSLATAVPPPSVANDFEALVTYRRIRAYCLHHRLDQTPDEIEHMILAYRNKNKPYRDLMDKLIAKFGQEPLNHPDVQAAIEYDRRCDFALRIERLLHYYGQDPTEEEVGFLLDECVRKKRKYEYLMQRLIAQYGPEPSASLVDLKEQRRRQQSAAHEGATSVEVPSSAPAPLKARAYRGQLTLRQRAELRLRRFAAHHGWKRTDEQLQQLLDDAENRAGGYEALFARLVRSFGPEPDSPIALDGGLEDGEEQRLEMRDKLQVYCSHYRLMKTDAECEKLLDDFEAVGYDVMWERLEGKFGPVPWGVEKKKGIGGAKDAVTHVAPFGSGATGGAKTASSGAGSPTIGGERSITNSRRAMLRRFAQGHGLLWTDAELDTMISRNKNTFPELCDALERKYGAVQGAFEQVTPFTALSDSAAASPSQVAASIARLSVSDGMNQKHPSSSSSRAHSDQASESSLLNKRKQARLSERKRHEDDHYFWKDRVRQLFELHDPSNAGDDDVEAAMAIFLDRGLSYEQMWSQLVLKFGPEASARTIDSTRNYWKAKFRYYLDYYNIKKSDAELETMMDDFQPKGWARMYDRLIELHGPPPPLPPTTLGPVNLTPAQWRERLRHYCRVKFPAKSADEIDLYLDQFESTQGSLETLYATLVLLHGLERPDGADPRLNDPRVVGPSSATANDAAYRKPQSFDGVPSWAAAGMPRGPSVPSDAGGPVPTRIERGEPPPRTFFPSPQVVVVATISFKGFDIGLYHISPPAVRHRFCLAVESDVANVLRIGDNRVHVQSLQAHGKDVAIQTALSLPDDMDPRFAADEIVKRVLVGAFQANVIKRSYMEDLGGNPLALRAVKASVAEVRSATLEDVLQRRDDGAAASGALHASTEPPVATSSGRPMHRSKLESDSETARRAIDVADRQQRPLELEPSGPPPSRDSVSRVSSRNAVVAAPGVHFQSYRDREAQRQPQFDEVVDPRSGPPSVASIVSRVSREVDPNVFLPAAASHPSNAVVKPYRPPPPPPPPLHSPSRHRHRHEEEDDDGAGSPTRDLATEAEFAAVRDAPFASPTWAQHAAVTSASTPQRSPRSRDAASRPMNPLEAVYSTTAQRVAAAATSPRATSPPKSDKATNVRFVTRPAGTAVGPTGSPDRYLVTTYQTTGGPRSSRDQTTHSVGTPHRSHHRPRSPPSRTVGPSTVIQRPVNPLERRAAWNYDTTPEDGWDDRPGEALPWLANRDARQAPQTGGPETPSRRPVASPTRASGARDDSTITPALPRGLLPGDVSEHLVGSSGRESDVIRRAAPDSPRGSGGPTMVVPMSVAAYHLRQKRFVTEASSPFGVVANPTPRR